MPTSPNPARDRAVRGLALFEAGAVSELEHAGLYLVRSSSRPGTHHLVFCATRDGAPARCSCQDQTRRGGRCAHLFAVAAFLVRDRKIERSVALACIAAPERAPRPVPPAPRRPIPRAPRSYQGPTLAQHHADVNTLLAQAERAGQLAGLTWGGEARSLQ